MECNKVLLDSVNKTLRSSMGKAVIGLLVVFLCSSLATPLVLLFAFGGSMVLPVLMLILCTMFTCMLMFGFMTLLTMLYRNRQAILGHVFSAFRDWRRSASASFVFSVAMVSISMVVALAGVSLFITDMGGGANTDLETLVSQVMQILPLLSAVCMVVFIAVVLFPNAFVWLVLSDNPAMGVRQAFRVSLSLQKGRRLRFLSFLLRCGGLWLAVACVAFVVSVLLTSMMTAQFLVAQKALASILSVVVKLCDLVYFIGFYGALVRVLTGVVAFYDSLVADDSGKSCGTTAEAIAPPVIELPSPDEHMTQGSGLDD